VSAPWTAWGSTRPTLSRGVRATLQDALGDLESLPEAAIADVAVAPSRLPPAARAALVTAVGDEAVHDDAQARARHAGGQAYADIIRRRRGDTSQAPDVVVVPRDAAAVTAAVRVCSEHRLAVVPWGGGTSVVGGLDAVRGDCHAVVALDLAELNQMLALDATSLVATFEPGIRAPAAEAALNAAGFTLGHFPQSYERASLGGYVVTRSAGQASSGYGRIDDLVVGLRMATPVGDLHLPVVPASAAGPDLRRLVLGSEGTLGVVTEVSMRVHPMPPTRRYEGWMLPSWDAGVDALRTLAQHRTHPDITRLSDPDETRISLALSSSGATTRRLLATYLRLRHVDSGCLVITGYEGEARDVRHRRRASTRVLRAAGAVSLGSRAGQSWEHGRFGGPHLRDSLLDLGVLVETLETAATWTALPGLYDAVRRALHGALERAVVGCHISHLYPTGASLYFTVLAAAHPGGEIEQWSAAKTAANDAIIGSGGTITHHHAVGTAHRAHATADLGGLGVEMLAAVKQRVDPNGVMNPGKLIPDITG
jgi:alkyldihydroxyacetonephosphate synthase